MGNNSSEISSFKVKFLKAHYGDSIWISFIQGNQRRNILIDGGPTATYRTQAHQAGALKNVLEELKKNGEMIDLLIITHVDNDHICGILKWIENDDKAHEKIGEVWFNSEENIAKELNEPARGHATPMTDTKNKKIGYKEGKSLEDYLTRNNKICWRKIVKKTDKEIPLFGGALRFKILSPNEERLKYLLLNWDWQEEWDDVNQKQKFTKIGAGKTDYEPSLKDLLEVDSVEKFKEDIAPHNGSSIAFILNYNDKNLLFLADAHPSVIAESLGELHFSDENPIKAELVKLSHHGSKYNNSREMLKMIKSDKFVISTSGMGQAKHPHKQLLARLLSIHNNCKLYFTYPELIDKVFNKEDFNNQTMQFEAPKDWDLSFII